MLAIGYLDYDRTTGAANVPLIRAGGAFGIIAAFAAWYALLHDTFTFDKC